MPSVKLSSLSYLGMAIETTLGTAVAPTAFIPVRGFKPQDVPKYIPDQGMRGLPVDAFGEYLGPIHSEYEIEGDFYPTSGGNLLAAFFGQDTITGSSNPYTHTFKGVAIPPSQTISDNYVANFRQFAGSKCDKLELKFNADSGLTYTAHYLGFPSATGTPPGTQTFSSDPFFLGWEAALTLGGAANAKLQSFQLSLQRAGSEAIFSAQNTQNPYDIFVGPIQASWQLGFFMMDDTEYSLALSQATKAVSVTLTQPGTNDALTLTSSAVQFTKPSINRSKKYVMVQLSGTAVYNATDAGVVQAVLKNEIAGSYVTTAAS